MALDNQTFKNRILAQQYAGKLGYTKEFCFVDSGVVLKDSRQVFDFDEVIAGGICLVTEQDPPEFFMIASLPKGLRGYCFFGLEHADFVRMMQPNSFKAWGLLADGRLSK